VRQLATASTKSRARKGKGAAATDTFETFSDSIAGNDDAQIATPSSFGAELSPRVWLIACGAVLLVAALLRFYNLDLKPLHHDEGVNGFFLTNLLRSGVFRYDPSNYHGPTLYYFTLPLAYVADKLGRLDTTLIRSVTALFGIATVWLALCLRRQLGMIGALAAAALLAVSPGAVFFSRYYIHEMLFVFFTLGIVVALVKFYEAQKQPAASDGRFGIAGAAATAVLVAATLGAVYQPQYFRIEMFLIGLSLSGLAAALWLFDGARVWQWLLAWVSVALLFATKETAFISIGVLLIAWGMSWSYVNYFERRRRAREERQSKKKRRNKAGADGDATNEPEPVGLIERLGGWPHLSWLLLAGVGVFLFVNIIFFSSFFTHPKGVVDSLKAYAIWQDTGTSDFHRKSFFTYFDWLFAEEALLLLLGALGAFFAVKEARRRFALFAALWAGGIIAAYSLVPYKTPWLALSMIVPLALAGGYGIQSLYRLSAHRSRALKLALIPLALAVAVAAYQTFQINFVHYDEDRYIYVYAHTNRQYDEMMHEVGRLAARTGAQYNASINVASPDYWPMPWYVRDYKRVAYAGTLGPTVDQDIVIINTTQEAQARTTLGTRYQRIGQYALRPGVDLVLYAKRELAQP